MQQPGPVAANRSHHVRQQHYEYINDIDKQQNRPYNKSYHDGEKQEQKLQHNSSNYDLIGDNRINSHESSQPHTKHRRRSSSRQDSKDDTRRRESHSQPPPIRRNRITSSSSHHQNLASSSSGIPHQDSSDQTWMQPENSATNSTTRSNLTTSTTPAPTKTSMSNRSNSRRAISVSPSLTSGVNIRHLLENVAETEGPFKDPSQALKSALGLLESSSWSSKVEGILSLIRLAAYNDAVIASHIHEIVCLVTTEARNLRSTVSRSAIFILGYLITKLGKRADSEIDTIVHALMDKSIENTAFIRSDLKLSLSEMIDSQASNIKVLQALLRHGSRSHNCNTRRMAAEFVAKLVQKIGPDRLLDTKASVPHLLAIVAEMCQDRAPQTRYFGRVCFSHLIQHLNFDKKLRSSLPVSLFNSCRTIVEAVKLRGPGPAPLPAMTDF